MSITIKRFSTRTVACIALLSLAGGLWPSTAHAQSLIDTLSRAYSYSPLIDAERARLRATDEDVARANSGFRPDIGASFDTQHNHTSIRSGGNWNTQKTSPYGYSVGVVQPIFRGFQVVNAVNSAEALVRAGREQLRFVEQQVLLDAVTAYGDVVRDQEVVRLRQNNVEFLSTELRATKDRFSVGEVTRTDVAQAEARRALAVSELDLARANLEISRAKYEQVVGVEPGRLREANPQTSLVPRTLNEAVNISDQEFPSVVGALYLEQAARYDVDRIRGELLPQAQIEANYSDRFNTSRGIDEVESTTVVGRVNVPIYEAGGEVHARIRQAKHTHVSRIQEIEQARAEARNGVNQSWAQLQAFRAQRESDRVQIEANQIALNGVREEEKVGQRTLIEVLNAQQELLVSQVQLETTKRNILVSTYSVISAIGRLNVAEVGAASSVYVPEEHHSEVRRKWWGISITHEDGRREYHDMWNPTVEHEPVK